jgi:SAM-dependent methyltransferase
MDYDKTNIPEMYNRGRDHGPAFLQQWMRVVSAHIGEVHDVLDLGCGTGRFSNSLAVHFDANVIGIDPSRKMLMQALGSPGAGRVCYVGGSGEALPLPSNAVDMIFISMVFHHLKDPNLVAQEAKRVLRESGRVFLRTGSLEKIEDYPYVPFFPTSRALLVQRLPSLATQLRAFEAASFDTLHCGVVTQEIAPNYSAYADKLSVKADSVLASLSDREFEEGIEALRAASAAGVNEVPVVEPIDFAVFSVRR